MKALKKNMPLVIGVVLILVVGIGIWASYNNKDDQPKNTTETTQTTQTTYKVFDACSVVTQTMANDLLGSAAQKTEPTTPNTTTDALAISSCSFSTNPGDANAKTLSLLVSAAKTDEGSNSNGRQFSDSKPAEATDVSGYGEAAFWNPTYGQLNILKNHNWYVLINGSTTPADRTLDAAKAFADKIIDQL